MNDKYDYKDGLESVRLRTRFLTENDIPVWGEFFKDEDAVKLFPPAFLAHGQNNATVWVKRQIERYEKQLYGLQALIDKNTNEFVGQCGLLKQEVDGKFEIEVGYHVLKKYWGKAYAPEAARLFIDFALANGVSSVISIIDERNVNSQRVAQKNGLKIDKKTTWNDLNVIIYRTQTTNR